MPDRIRIKVNRHVCSGCLSCMTTCSMANELYASLAGARVRVDLSPFGDTHRITLCPQCAATARSEAACLEACREGAIRRDAQGGHLVVDYSLCTGCLDCVEACPLDAMFWNPISKRVIKCELCHGDPQCVQACPTGSLTIRVVAGRKNRENHGDPS
jgi:carbon-monoxide dehydrogenase iron sulfur subunit